MNTKPEQSDDECPICGSGYFLPSGVCDHCDQPRGTEPVTYRKSAPDMVMAMLQDAQREVLTERARAEKFKRAVIEMLENNGGPIDGFDEDGTQETSDGKDYVMVLREDFERLEAMVKETEVKETEVKP